MINSSPIYAGLLALLFLYLSLRVVQARIRHKVSVGDGGQPDVVKAMRVQANCAEYAPIGILLLLMAELQGMPVWLVHVFGLMLLAGRGLHGWGMGSTPQIIAGRQWGMRLTLSMIALTALANIGHALF